MSRPFEVGARANFTKFCRLSGFLGISTPSGIRKSLSSLGVAGVGGVGGGLSIDGRATRKRRGRDICHLGTKTGLPDHEFRRSRIR